MDDVDRLFECFKCGISPPQSALRERKRSKIRLKQTNSSSINEASVTPSPESSVHRKKTATSKGFSPVVFYGSPHGAPPPKRPISLLRLLHEIRLDLAHQQKPDLRKEVWATFPRQNEAMNFAKQHVDVRVFSYQDHYNGLRRFLVSNYKEFWRRYKSMDPKFRHHYEVIQEGLLCHLYFDLEFNKRENPTKNGNDMVDHLISVILEALLEKYSIEGTQDWIVELDSSTSEKFSRHLIIRIPKTAFKDNSHAGAFISEICSRISNAREIDDRLGNLFVQKDKDSTAAATQLFVDTSVYSRNRCFRLALSSKAGKSSFLLPTGRFKCKNMCEEEMFMASLICSMDSDCERLLVCKMDLDCVKTLHFDSEVAYDYRQGSRPQESLVNSQPTNGLTTYLVGKSPFPAVDKFIESICSIGSSAGKIQSWYWFSEYGLMVFNMSRNRYCERIGREHKSNHVIYVVDLKWGFYYQKCHDPDCRGYKSPARPIPMDLVCDPSLSNSSVEMVHQMWLKSDNNNPLPLFNDDDYTEGCDKESWWLEAIEAADNIESKRPSSLELDRVEINEDEDDDFWTAVERTASQAELHISVKLCGSRVGCGLDKQ